MKPLTIYHDNHTGVTMLSNQFIDEYMADANDAQIKIYLYIIRMSGASMPFSLSDIADRFNYTEKDVVRALCYWEKKKLISMDFDMNQNLKALHILPIDESKSEALTNHQTSHTSESNIGKAEVLTLASRLSSSSAMANIVEEPVQPTYSSNDLAAFKENEETSQIIFVAEQYTGKPLSPSDLQTLLFIYDSLGFSTDLIDYLIQYCVDRGKKKFSYIQKVAIDWSESHISTVRQAKLRANKFDKSVYSIMNALGRTSTPTDAEVTYINRWLKEWGLSLDVILIACERTVLATEKNRFAYANGILSKWADAHVKNVKDIEALDEKHNAVSKKSSMAGSKTQKQSGGFTDFNQRTYNYAELEKLLRSN